MIIGFAKSSTWNVKISIDPTTPIINHVFETGDVAGGSITVANTGNMQANVYMSAIFRGGPFKATREALLINALGAQVNVTGPDDSLTAFTGRLVDLNNVFIWESLIPGETIEVEILVTMPEDKSGPALLNQKTIVDFAFVAEEQIRWT